MLLTALALLAVEEPPATDTCALFARLLAAARETPAFDSVRQALARGEVVVPGFDAAECEVAEDALYCRPRDPEAEGLFARQRQIACPGLTEDRRAISQFGRAYTFGGPDGVRISFGLRCHHCAGAPGTAWFRVARAVRRTGPSAP